MTKAEEILEKHLSNNLDQKIYLKGSMLTYDICLDAINEAINYTQCCNTFTVKEEITFYDWCKANNYTQKFLYFFNKNGESFNPYEIHRKWRSYVDSL
jgi:hypothetical protein